MLFQGSATTHNVYNEPFKIFKRRSHCEEDFKIVSFKLKMCYKKQEQVLLSTLLKLSDLLYPVACVWWAVPDHNRPIRHIHLIF